VDKTRDDFFAGSRLAQQQDSGFRRSHLSRLFQHLMPFDRFTDHATITRPGVQLVGQGANARFELGGALSRLVRPSGGLDFAITG
jgi:hypothetical protein